MSATVNIDKPVNVRLTLSGDKAKNYRLLMSRKGVTVDNQLVYILLAEESKREGIT